MLPLSLACASSRLVDPRSMTSFAGEPRPQGPLPARATARAALPRLTQRLPLGGSTLRVSPFCLGRVRTPDTVPAAFDAGINFFFLSADMHWPLYGPTRRGLAHLLARGGGIRDQIVVAAVCYPTQPEFCTAPFEEVVDELPALQRIDVAVMGGAYAADFPVRLPVFQRHRSTAFLGIRALGATFHDRAAARIALGDGLLEIGFVRYNAAHTGAAADLFPDLVRPRPALLFGFKSTAGYVDAARVSRLGLGNDAWRPQVVDHYRFALTRSELDGILCSPSTPAEVRALDEALARGPLDAEEEKFLWTLCAPDPGRVAPAARRGRSKSKR